VGGPHVLRLVCEARLALGGVERKAALRELEVARGEFEAAMERVPDQALGHLKAGDDYCLSGLVPHCEYVLRHYSAVLDGMQEGTEFRAVDPPDLTAWHMQSSRDGFPAGRRTAALESMAAAHEQAVERLRGARDWTLKVLVLYGADASEPYPTSAEDVAGWLIDHYREHVPHAADLLADWEQAPRPVTQQGVEKRVVE
jgi:hypothetical protein